MKQRAVLLVIAILSFHASAVLAQAPEKPNNVFPTKAACEAAMKSGNFRYYEPKFLGLKSREPIDNNTRVRVPLETDQCVDMQVVGGRRFVVQKEGTKFRAHVLPDGSLSLYARDDCGNRVYGAVFPAPAQPVTEAEPVPAPFAPPVYGPPPPVEKAAYHEPEIRKGHKKWPWVLAGIIGGGAYATYYFWPCPPGTTRK